MADRGFLGTKSNLLCLKLKKQILQINCIIFLGLLNIKMTKNEA